MRKWEENAEMIAALGAIQVLGVHVQFPSDLCFRVTSYFRVKMYPRFSVPLEDPQIWGGGVTLTRPSRGIDANQKKLATVRSHTENYRQSYSIRTAREWNALPQPVVSGLSKT